MIDVPSPDSAAPAEREERPGEPPPGTLPPEGVLPTAKAADDWMARAMGVPSDDRSGATDGGSSPYAPAVTPSGFPNASAGGVQPAVGGYGEAVAAAPPVPRRSVARSLARLLREVAETIVLALLIFLAVRAVVQNFQVEGSSMQPTLRSGWYLLVNKAVYWEINLKTVNKFLPFVDPGDDPTSYIFRGPRRGDIIVFRAPDQRSGQEEKDYIKRVIAEPGEVVEMRKGTVLIDNMPLDEPYIFTDSQADLAAAIDDAETVLSVSNGGRFDTGDTLRIDGEEMDIVSTASDELTVTRGVNGTTASAHAANADVDLRPLPADFGPVTVPPGCYFVMGDNRTNSSDSRGFGAVPKGSIIGRAWLTYWPFSVFGLVDSTSAEPGSGGAPEPQKEPADSTTSWAAAPLAECSH